jgi:hypothetical protein
MPGSWDGVPMRKSHDCTGESTSKIKFTPIEIVVHCKVNNVFPNMSQSVINGVDTANL